MTFTFLNMAGKTLFVRDDAERAQWTQEELHLDLEFPYVADKEISTGQRVFFKDPATGRHQIYEIKQAKSQEPDHYQIISAEHICISELTDEHMDSKEVENKSVSSTLKSVLSGTLWSVGTVSTDPVSSADLSRGSVWQAVLEIRQNWNVYIEPRVTLRDDGTINRRLLILPVDGVWNGVRLSIDKNMLDPSVTIDDSEVVTALYGYGGTTTPQSAEEEAVEITFKDIAWSKTKEHPAKPAGQKYIEDPEATKLYGRNGRARFGYYQNTDIEDPNVLLQKTWENLKFASTPDVSIEGTVEDLYRMGYTDQPLELHTLALVEVSPVGFKKQIQIIRMTVDLLDPTATTLTIGKYIPNIVYINHATAVDTTGEQGGRSGGGGGGGAPKQTERSEYETEIIKNNREIKLRAYQNDLDDLDAEVKLQEAYIDIQADRITQEVTDRRNADDTLNSIIEQTATQIRSEVSKSNSTIYSKIIQTASQIRSEVNNTASGLYSRITQTASQIRSEVSKSNSTIYSKITQTATQIRSEVRDTESRLSSKITQTASQIRSEVNNTASGLYSSITQTASQIRSEVSNTASGLYSRITQTASQIRSEVSESSSTLYTAITQTASQIRSEVNNTASGLYSSITQTASQIRSEVSSSNSTIYSAITQTASQIRSEVTNTTSNIYSSIKQNADNIELKVSKDGIISSINQSAEGVTINAGKINLYGYVTASQLAATQADIDNLLAGNTSATLIKAGSIQTGTLRVNGQLYSLKETNIPNVGWIHYLGY